MTGRGSRSGRRPSEDADMAKTASKDRKPKKPKERWLLTRKTWRYMADAGRKLIPDGAHNRPEDIPKIEAYFQEMCQKEPRFLLWRKSSYPGALGFRTNKKRREHRKGGSCRNKASSADEADVAKHRHGEYEAISQKGGKFDLQKLKYDFLNQPPPPPSAPNPFSRPKPASCSVSSIEEEQDDAQLADMLEKYLNLCEGKSTAKEAQQPAFDYNELIDKLQKHLATIAKLSASQESLAQLALLKRETIPAEGDIVQRSLSETLSRYYSRSPNRERVISNLLTDRKVLEKLYFDLRKTKNFSFNRPAGTSSSSGSSSDFLRGSMKHLRPTHLSWKDSNGNEAGASSSASWFTKLSKHSPTSKRMLSGHMSPPPLIEIQGESQEPIYNDWGVQTDPVPEHVLAQCEDEYRKLQAEREEEMRDSRTPSLRRRSSVDNDDVSQSVSDTIKRYLRMARKKTADGDKADRFKRVNYDRNLRNIKAKGEITKPGDDDGLNKGCQTNEEWIVIYKDLKFDEAVFSDPETSPGSRVTSSRSSIDAAAIDDVFHKQHSNPSSPPEAHPSKHSFISNLLHGRTHDKPTATGAPAVAMQKSKSSSSVVHHGSRLVAKKIFRSRSKSQSRAQPVSSSWTPQGKCVWSNVAGRQVTLADTNIIHLTEVERQVLQKVALAKLQAINLGVTIKAPTENVGAVVHKPKRRAYLLKRKALTTGFFDTGRTKDCDKDKDGSNPSAGLVFGIPLNQCIENDRVGRLNRTGSRGDLEESGLRHRSHHGSRASFSSLLDANRNEDSGSCESIMSRERIAGSVPGLLDTISCGSAADLAVSSDEPGVPNMVTACLKHLETHGLRTLGIFRVSTSKKRVRQLREDFDCGKETVLGDDQCPHDVATLLKEYLRDLPDPLLCRDLYQGFVQTQKIRNRRLQFEALQHLVQLLPSANRDTLWSLLNFLANVARNANDGKDATGEWVAGNKMDSNNLATVFAPNVLHCMKPGSAGMPVTTAKDAGAEDRIDVINVVRTMIDHNRQLFQIPAELLDEVYVHMMDSHPEELDQLLNKRDCCLAADESVEDVDSESSSAPWTPTATTELPLEPFLGGPAPNAPEESETASSEPRKIWSREEFLHENAGTGGPNMAMRLRHRERIKERSAKKRWRDDSSSRRRTGDESTSSSGSLSSAMTIINRLRGQKEDEHHHHHQQQQSNFVKIRSSSIDGAEAVGDHHHQVVHQVSHRGDDRPDRRQSSPLVLDAASAASSGGVITASLKIPVQSHPPMALSLDDADIPYIEDADGSRQHLQQQQQHHQQMTIGMVRGPAAPPRRRQRSISSDSSQASNIQPITGSISLVQQGYDSALGSSATISSPPHNTTPSSVSSSIAGDAGMLSSPPSWASTPPTSPDSAHKAVNYIPDDIVPLTRITLPVKSASAAAIPQRVQQHEAKDVPILQKVSIISTSEVRQPRQVTIQPAKEAKPATATTTTATARKDEEKKEFKFTPSISSIGGAVLRSKTADFERMLAKTSQPEKAKPSTSTTPSQPQPVGAEKKKYTKRRYTDSRHQTRHIPDAESLEASATAPGAAAPGATASAAVGPKKEEQQAAVGTALQPTVYKRREIIASVPKDR